MPADFYSVTLAAGTGSRMPGDMPPKPCCKVGPLSVIENALQAYEQAGIHKHLVVVGFEADGVMETVCRARRDVLFAYQSERRGTGDAVRCALDFLASVAPPQHVLICAGDKVIEPHVIRGLTETYVTSGAALCLVAGRSEHYPGSGRILLKDGKAVAVVEVPDIAVRRIAAALRSIHEDERPTTVGELAALTSDYIADAGKLAAYFPALGHIVRRPSDQALSWKEVVTAVEGVPEGFDVPGGFVSAEEASAAELCNLSVYVGRFALLQESVRELGMTNVQGECYFTDVVEALARGGHVVETFRLHDPKDVMAFNTLEQLEEVRKVHAERALTRARYPKLESWGNYFLQRPGMRLHAEAVRELSRKIGSERPCVVACSPGRINLMGRHIDHQGGMCNLMAIDRQIVIAASPRQDDRINLWNSQAMTYQYRSFSFAELTADIAWEDWLHTLDSQFVQRMMSKNAGDWVNYVKGAALRLKHRFKDRKVRGMDAFVSSNIPVGAGLSSSSALVVAVSEALTELNGLNVRAREFVDLCGEAEWFVGNRGGSGDHAAIKLGGQQEVVAVTFFPFELVGRYPFPRDCSVIVCSSGLSPEDAEELRGRLNARIACYHIAGNVIRREFPEFAPLIQHLRDVNTRRLDISLPALYGLLKRVPTLLRTEEVEAFATEDPAVAKCVTGLNLKKHDFRPRDVALYGLAECERALRAGEALQQGDAAGLGSMMNVSHDGDRVVRCRPHCEPFENRVTDDAMESLIARSAGMCSLSGSGAALWQQPGSYGCSMPRMDLLVDRALACPEVLGAQLAGAGVGGCVMILVRSESVQHVGHVLEETYYEREGVAPLMFACRPSHGSYVLTSVETP